MHSHRDNIKQLLHVLIDVNDFTKLHVFVQVISEGYGVEEVAGGGEN